MKIHTLLFTTLIVLSACSAEPIVQEETSTLDDKGAWDGGISLAISSNGLDFEHKEQVLKKAGVPNLLQLQSGDLVLTYQYFSDTDEDMFDVIAYSVSEDSGATWSEPELMDFGNLPEPLDEAKVPMDPTLVQLEDGRLRMYFTYHAKGNKTAVLYSATTDDAEIDSTFVVNPIPALVLSDAFLLDPAVTYFDGLWHHYSWQNDSDNNYHSTSTDGLTFTLQDEINLPMDFLGQVIPFEDGLRFYGTGQGSVVSAFSSDGYTWEIDEENIIQGVDPAVQELEDGSYIMVYTSMNFN